MSILPRKFPPSVVDTWHAGTQASPPVAFIVGKSMQAACLAEWGSSTSNGWAVLYVNEGVRDLSLNKLVSYVKMSKLSALRSFYIFYSLLLSLFVYWAFLRHTREHITRKIHARCIKRQFPIYMYSSQFFRSPRWCFLLLIAFHQRKWRARNWFRSAIDLHKSLIRLDSDTGAKQTKAVQEVANVVFY